MSEPLCNWLRGMDYVPYAEVPDRWNYRRYDLVGIKNGLIIVIEMKKSLTKGLILQARIGLHVADNVYCAVSTHPRNASIHRCRNLGIGVLEVRGDRVIEIIPSCIYTKTIESYRDVLLERTRTMVPGGLAGVPNVKGVGPAKTVNRLVEAYRMEHPRATWKELYDNVPNHYTSFSSMYGAMRLLKKRGG